MSETVRAEALAYLAGHNVLSLATFGPEGPWSAAVFYASEGFTLYFVSSATTRHGRNLAADPRAASTIQEDYDDWRDIKGLQIEGRVERVPDAEKARVAGLYAEKFPATRPDRAPPEIAAALARIGWYRLVPSRVLFIDNARGLGHREEVPLR
jgi:hypothetical protein